MLFGRGHALFNIFPKLLEIDIHVSTNRGHLLIENFFNKPSLNSVQFLSWIHLVDGIYFGVQMVNLFLASIESFLKMDQFFFELGDLFEDTLLLAHNDIVIPTWKARTIYVFAEIKLNSFDPFLFIAILISLPMRLFPRVA